jgi:hypothetical protein
VVVTTTPFATTASKSFTLPNIDTIVTLPAGGTVTLVGGQVAVTTTKLEAKAQAYHYGMGVHAIGSAGCNSPSGLAEPLGNDFIIALGCTPFGESDATHAGQEGTWQEQAGTVLHELGHNFNLAHGGPSKILVTSGTDTAGTVPTDKDQNCKPNHISVMNYARQVPLPLGYLSTTNWNLSYSSGLFSGFPLTETALVESSGLRSSSATTPQIVYSAIPTGSGAIPVIKTGSSTAAAAGTATAIDWDNNPATLGTSASTDINNFGIVGCGPTTGVVLKDHDEWNNLEFNFRTATGAQALDGTHSSPHKTAETTSNIEITTQQSVVDSGYYSGPKRPTLTITGYYTPVMMPNNLNLIKNGQTVPFKFEVFDRSVEKTSLSTISKFLQIPVSCTSPYPPAAGPTVDIKNKNGSTLKYDTLIGQFNAGWKTPSGNVGNCYKIFTNSTDGQSIFAYYKLTK